MAGKTGEGSLIKSRTQDTARGEERKRHRMEKGRGEGGENEIWGRIKDFLCGLNSFLTFARFLNPSIKKQSKIMNDIILCIETSTDVCSAAICRGSEVLSYRISEDAANTGIKDGIHNGIKDENHSGGVNHSQLLPRYIDELTEECRLHGWQVSCVAVSSGPGSYTGLRIGVSMAKGLAYGWGVPLVGVPSLQVLCEQVLSKGYIEGVVEAAEGKEKEVLLCPMIDARRMEVYAALYDRSLREVMGLRAQVVADGGWLPQKEIYYFGNGAAKCKDVLENKHIHLIHDIRADARYMGRLAARKMDAGQTADVAYFEPEYLKEFVAAPSHIKGLE